MAKFHVTENGVGKCSAKIRCPFGGESGQENHYDTIVEAAKDYEKNMESETFNTVSKAAQPKAAKEQIAEAAKKPARSDAERKLVREATAIASKNHDRRVEQIEKETAEAAENIKRQISAAEREINSYMKMENDMRRSFERRNEMRKSRKRAENRLDEYKAQLDMLSEEKQKKISASLAELAANNKEYTNPKVAGDVVWAEQKRLDDVKYNSRRRRQATRVDRPKAIIEDDHAQALANNIYNLRREEQNPNVKANGFKLLEVRGKIKENIKALEESGRGYMVPDVPGKNTIRVRNRAQKILLEGELQGQISDGLWENTPGNPWSDWSNADVVVDPDHLGRNFYTRKDNYQLNAKALLDVVGDRMVESVRKDDGDADYDSEIMAKDLKDLRTIFKTKRSAYTAVDSGYGSWE